MYTANMPLPEHAYSSNTLADCAGVSLRQLQWWDERKIVSPTHSGHRRLYSPSLALLVMVVAALRRKGLTLFDLRKGLPVIKKTLAKEHKRIEFLLLAVDSSGTMVGASPHAHTLIDALRQADNPAWVIDIGELVARLPQIPTLEKGAAA